MNGTLHFKLKVPDRDSVSLTGVTSIAFSFRGLLRLEPDHLYIEWTGNGVREEVGIFGVEKSEVPLPLEAIEVPLTEIRLMRLHGGWLRPRITLATHALDGLRMIPSEEDGVARFWIARADRDHATALITATLGGNHG